jgi:hypothetical protein
MFTYSAGAQRLNFEMLAREDHTSQIYQITFEAPKIRVILALVAESVVKRKLKICIWCSIPQPQLFELGCLAEAGPGSSNILIWPVVRRA